MDTISFAVILRLRRANWSSALRTTTSASRTSSGGRRSADAASDVTVTKRLISANMSRIVVPTNEWRLSAEANEVDGGGAAYRWINLVGKNRRDGIHYGDCKADAEVLTPMTYPGRLGRRLAGAGNRFAGDAFEARAIRHGAWKRPGQACAQGPRQAASTTHSSKRKKNPAGRRVSCRAGERGATGRPPEGTQAATRQKGHFPGWGLQGHDKTIASGRVPDPDGHACVTLAA